MNDSIRILFALVHFSVFISAQTGKLSGRVTDLETGEPLIGANIIISGTNLGASSDINGEYIILNIPPNTYSVTAKYIGYTSLTQSNTRISVNVTTLADFELSYSAFEMDEIVITAPKPLIDKNLTNTVNIITHEDIEHLPVRGINEIVGTKAGIVTQGGNIYIRGSRSDQAAFYLDGVLVNNPFYGGATTMGIQNAVQEIQFQAGGYPAEYGGANAGIVTTTTKIGGEKLKLSLETITDNFGMDMGEKFLGTYSTGYSEYVMTASGPLFTKNLRFFAAGSNVFRRSPAGFHRGLNFQDIYDPGAAAVSRDTFDIVYPEGYRLNQAANTYQVQGNISLDLNPFTLKVSGSYLLGESRNGVGYQNFNTFNRAGLHEDETITGSLKLTHVISDKAFYDVIFNYFSDYSIDMDPLLKHNITAYGDSVVNAGLGTTLSGDGSLPRSLTAYNITFTRSDIPYDLYRKFRFQNIGGQVNLLYQAGKHHEIKTGIDFKRYNIRLYSVSPVSIAGMRRSITEPLSPYDYYFYLNNIGYDVYGNIYNGSGLEAPRSPIFAAWYIQDKIEYSDLVINAGFRLDYIDTDSKEFLNPFNIIFDSNDQVDPAGMKDSNPAVQLSPRLGFAFPVTDKTVFHTQYGKFIQQSRLRDVYLGYNFIARDIKAGHNNPVGFGLKPERTTQYELGFKQQIGSVFAFDITGFYKDIKDQVQVRQIYAEEGAKHKPYHAFVNVDFSTVKGIELRLNLRRTERIAASVEYTFSDAKGTGSNPSSSFRQISASPTSIPFFPQQIAPLDFNQAHTTFINIDYRFAGNDGPYLFGSQILSNAGVNILISAKSGYSYTRFDNNSFEARRFPIEALNSSTTPWTLQVDLKLDKSLKLGPFESNIYLWIINIFNKQNVLDVFRVSGDPYNDGFLTSRTGSAQVQNIRSFYGNAKAEEYKALYNALQYNYNFYGPPRQIIFGIKFNY